MASWKLYKVSPNYFGPEFSEQIEINLHVLQLREGLRLSILLPLSPPLISCSVSFPEGTPYSEWCLSFCIS